jgi:hypothetical protein
MAGRNQTCCRKIAQELWKKSSKNELHKLITVYENILTLDKFNLPTKVEIPSPISTPDPFHRADL